jgi:hypothetical protein
LNTTSALSTPLTLTVTNDNNDILMFTFSSLQATSSGNGALNLYWLGSFTSDSDHAYSTDSYAKLSAAFTESALNAIVNVSFSLEDPPASSLLTWNGSSTSLSEQLDSDMGAAPAQALLGSVSNRFTNRRAAAACSLRSRR